MEHQEGSENLKETHREAKVKEHKEMDRRRDIAERLLVTGHTEDEKVRVQPEELEREAWRSLEQLEAQLSGKGQA